MDKNKLVISNWSLKFKYSEIHKFKLSSAENQRKRKRSLDNAQRQRKKIETQQTRTLDLLKGLCKKKQQKMMLEVFRVSEIGEPTILRPLSADEAHTHVFKGFCSQSHYNSLLFLHKNGCFSTDLCPQVDELLEQMASTIKTFPSLRVGPMTDGSRLSFPQLCQCD